MRTKSILLPPRQQIPHLAQPSEIFAVKGDNKLAIVRIVSK